MGKVWEGLRFMSVEPVCVCVCVCVCERGSSSLVSAGDVHLAQTDFRVCVCVCAPPSFCLCISIGVCVCVCARVVYEYCFCESGCMSIHAVLLVLLMWQPRRGANHPQSQAYRQRGAKEQVTGGKAGPSPGG